jgi:hypothetical protein
MFARPQALLSIVLGFGLLGAGGEERVAQHPRAAPGRSGVVVMGRPTAVVARAGAGARHTFEENTTQDPSAQNETTIAVDLHRPWNAVGGTNDYRFGDAQAGIAVTFDTGRSWRATTLDALDTTLGKYDAQGDPWVISYPGGPFYYSYIDFNRGDDKNRLCVARSDDGGLTWPQLGVVIDHAGAGPNDFEDKELIAVDATGGAFDGNLYIAWTRYPAGDAERVMFSRSVDGGATFSAPAQISDSTLNYQGTSPAIGPGGEVYVAWYHNSTVELDRSFDGGVTFGLDVVVSAINDISNPLPGAFFRLFSFPSLAVDRSGGPDDGNLYVVWADELGTGAGPDILLTRSTNGGATWSAPIRVSDDTNSSHQFFPAIDVDVDGRITVFFLDQRNAPGTPLYDAYITQSTDGGLTFRRNKRLTGVSSNSTLDGFGGGFIGDYSGVSVTRTHVFPYWCDTRPSNANAEGYVRRGLRWRPF